MTEHRQKMIEASLTACQTWTSLQIEDGNNPTLDDFLEQFPLFNVPYLVELIGAEMYNEKYKHELFGVSETIQTSK